MTVKRLEWEACDAHNCHCDIVESKDGDMVNYEDYAALLKERDALAAENSYLLGEIKQHSNSTHFCEKCGEADPCINDDVCWSLKHPLPATDAAIANIQARCVSDFIGRIEFVIRNECNPNVTERILNGLSEFAEEFSKESTHD